MMTIATKKSSNLMSELEVQSILNSNSWLESYEIAIVESQS